MGIIGKRGGLFLDLVRPAPLHPRNRQAEIFGHYPVAPVTLPAAPSADSPAATGRIHALYFGDFVLRPFWNGRPAVGLGRGDIHLGVSVTYSDINNTALLVEIAHKTGQYVPDLSFGTHFFQDLVEAKIRYLPLYPGESEDALNEPFFRQSGNLLQELVPELAHLADVVRVIEIPRATGGQVLKVLMNADLDEAVGFLAEPGSAVEKRPGPR